MQEVVRLQNPAALDLEPIQNLFRKAIATAKPLKGNEEAAFEALKGLVGNEDVAFLVGVENDLYKTLCVVSLPSAGFAPEPQIAFFYNSGSAILKDMVIEELLAYLKGKGMSKFWAVNASGHSDAAWSRVFKRAGKPRKIGTIMEFDLG